MLAIIRKRNPYLPTGTWVECMDDGCQKAIIETVDNRVRVVRTEGILFPKRQLEPYMIRTLKRGLDK